MQPIIENISHINMGVYSPVCRTYFTPQNKLLFTTFDGYICIYDIYKNEYEQKYKHSHAVTDIIICPEYEQNLIYYGDAKGSVGLIFNDFNKKTCEYGWRNNLHGSEIFVINVIKFSPQKKDQILVSVSERRVVMFNLQSRYIVQQYDFPSTHPIVDAEIYCNFVVLGQQHCNKYKIIIIENSNTTREIQKEIDPYNVCAINGIFMDFESGLVAISHQDSVNSDLRMKLEYYDL